MDFRHDWWYFNSKYLVRNFFIVSMEQWMSPQFCLCYPATVNRQALLIMFFRSLRRIGAVINALYILSLYRINRRKHKSYLYAVSGRFRCIIVINVIYLSLLLAAILSCCLTYACVRCLHALSQNTIGRLCRCSGLKHGWNRSITD